MSKKWTTKTVLRLFLAWFMLTSQIAFAKNHLTEQEALKLGTEAYIYGYPLVTMDQTRKVMTNYKTVSDKGAPMGQFFNVRQYPSASFRTVTAPNADTLYSTAWLNLTKEPYVLHLPDVGDRYYLMPFLSAWTNVFASLGSRTTGYKAQDYVITGPDWRGKLPPGIKQIKAPTNLVWVLGRTYSTGTPEDYKAVHKIQDQYALIPLSAWGKPYTPPPGKINPHIDMKTAVRDQVNAMQAAQFFNKLAILMKENPPARGDKSTIKKLKKIGIIPGRPFNIKKLPPPVAKALNDAVKVAQQKIQAHEKEAGTIENGWIVFLKTGDYGTDYMQRALIAMIGLGANRPQDSIYAVARTDVQGNPLDGANSYVIHFANEQMPPVNAFWSLTMYNPELFFVDNPLNRYTLSPRNNLRKNVDGSVSLYIQYDPPSKKKQSNWLPAPAGNFVLMFRFYWPSEEIISGTWKPPVLQKMK